MGSIAVMRVLTIFAVANAFLLAILVGLGIHGVYHRRCTETAARAAQAWQAVALDDLQQLVTAIGDNKSVAEVELVDMLGRHIQNDTEIAAALASGHAARAAEISTKIDWTYASRDELVREMDALYPKGLDMRVNAQHLTDRAADVCD